MKICIPTHDGRGLESRVHAHFGSAPWFTFVDTETGEAEAVENPACSASPGSCHHVGMLSRRGVNMVVSAGLGRRALAGLADAGIEVVVAPQRGVAEVVAMARAGELEPMKFEGACVGGFHHGRGHGRGTGRGQGQGLGRGHRHGHGHGGSCDHD